MRLAHHGDALVFAAASGSWMDHEVVAQPALTRIMRVNKAINLRAERAQSLVFTVLLGQVSIMRHQRHGLGTHHRILLTKICDRVLLFAQKIYQIAQLSVRADGS